MTGIRETLSSMLVRLQNRKLEKTAWVAASNYLSQFVEGEERCLSIAGYTNDSVVLDVIRVINDRIVALEEEIEELEKMEVICEKETVQKASEKPSRKTKAEKTTRKNGGKHRKSSGQGSDPGAEQADPDNAGAVEKPE